MTADPTGLTYLNNRKYDPALGNFTSVDPRVGNTGTAYPPPAATRAR